MTDNRAGLAAAWAQASRIEGWLTHDQAALLWAEASALPPGSTVVEIGSHQGRSTVVLAAALSPGSTLLAVDAFDPGWRYGGPETQDRLLAHLARAGVADRVVVRAETSRAVRSSYDGAVDLLYVDGGHDYRTVRDDLRWASRVPAGGTVLVHDAFGSVGVTLALARSMPVATRLAYTGRVGSLARLEARPPAYAERLRPAVGLPWFARNLVVKALLRLRWRGVARLLGHHDTADPF